MSAKPNHRIPRNTEQATALLERYAVLADQIAVVEAERSRGIAGVNAEADAEVSPLLEEQLQIREKLDPWWSKNSATLTKGKRKSIELGGCMIGSRTGRASLGMAEDIDPVIRWLEKRNWAGPLLRTTVSIDKAAVQKSLDGVYKKQLAQLGFRLVPGVETFFVDRTEQQGTQAGVAP